MSDKTLFAGVAGQKRAKSALRSRLVVWTPMSSVRSFDFATQVGAKRAEKEAGFPLLKLNGVSWQCTTRLISLQSFFTLFRNRVHCTGEARPLRLPA